MQKLKQKFAHRARVSTDSRVTNTSSPPESHPEASTQPSIEFTSSPANSEATGAGGRDVPNAERDPPWGLKLLYEGINPVVDIVALHGLNGHREKTWTFEGKGKIKGVLWLRDLLPSIIPNARVWSWGYDSRTRSKSHGEQLTVKSLYDHGRELVFELDGERRASNSHRRPIIFIVHSLGGIVVKSALLHSDRVREGNLEGQRSIKLSTYGIIFMGTPHQGGQGVSTGRILLNIAKAQGHTSDNLLRHLEVHSELLQQQLSEFTLICQDFEMYFAYEAKPTPIVGGVAMVIVPKWSAVVPGTPDAAVFGISEDHRRMTKFSDAENADFRKIVRILTSMIQTSGAKVESNWRVEALRKRAFLGAKTFEVPFDIRGVPIVNKYVERDREMSAVESSLSPGVANTQRRILVLHGLGGTGKTQLSLAYARKHRDNYTAIVWLNGQTQDSLKQSIAGIARSLAATQLPESARDNHQQGSVELGKLIDEVLEWFGKPGNTQWLLIYDNVDRDASDEAHDPEAYDIRKYFPNSDHGSIIITTRRLQLRHLGDELKVNTMTMEEGMDLLRNTLGGFRIDFSSATTLVNRLGALPLALAQAAAYIRETNSSITEYLLSYDSAWSVLMEDESHPDFAPREYDYRSVYTTWNVSFECIKQKNEHATSMLQLWSYLDNKDIWYSLFNNKQNWNLELWDSPLPEWFKRVMGKEFDFRRTVRILLAYSLIEAKEDPDAFAMHPVVHDWCRETLDASRRHEFMWLAITVVGFAAPYYTERGYWEFELRLLPHVSRCIVLPDNVPKECLQRHDLLDLKKAVWRLGDLCLRHVKFVEAEAMYQWALESDKNHSEGEVDPKPHVTAGIQHSLANLYRTQGKLDEAEALFQHVLTAEEALSGSGSDTHDKIMTMSNLGIVYRLQGKLAEAEAILKRTLAWCMNALGSDHLQTAGTFQNLALVYQGQGKLAEAESLFKRTLVVLENKVGPEHPETLQTVSYLGLCHHDQGQFVEAGIQFERALLGSAKVLGPDHITTLDTNLDLGAALLAQEKVVEAEIQFKRALSGYKNNKNHEATEEAAMKLSKIYKKYGKLAEAEAMWRLLLARFEDTLGPDHHLTLGICFQIGFNVMDQDGGRKLLQAEAMFQRALSGSKNNQNFEWTEEAAMILNEIYKKQGKLAEAEAMWRPLLAEFEAALGPDHKLTLDVCYELGLILMRQDWERNLSEAEAMLQRALLRNRYNEDYDFTEEAAIYLNEIYKKQGKLAEAEAMWRQLLAGFEDALGPDHMLTLGVCLELGRILDDEAKISEAEAMCQRTLSGYKKVLGLDHIRTVDSMYNLGLILKRQKKLHEAEDMFQQALSASKKIWGTAHQNTKDTAKHMSEIYEGQGRHEEAEAILKSVL